MKTTITKDEIKNSMKRYIGECQWTLDDDDYDGYDYECSSSGLDKITDEFLTQKAPLISLFEKSPHYNGKFQIVLKDESYKREVDKYTIRNFFDFLERTAPTTTYARYKSDLLSEWQEWQGFYCLYYDSWCANYELHAIVGEKDFNIYTIPVAIATKNPIYEMRTEIGVFSFNNLKLIEAKEFFDMFKDEFTIKTNTSNNMILKKENRENYVPFYNEILKNTIAINVLYRCANNTYNGLLDKSTADKINEIYPKLRATEGQKISRLVNKFCTKILKLEKSKGSDYEKMFADFADAINPLEVVRWTILSVHPVDFLAMSNGDNWSSCHTIDQICDVGDNYHGCYGSGTLSYMLDGSSFVFYTVSKKYNGDEFEFEPKINRCMFHYGNDKLIQGRVYPQDNDGINAVYDKIRPIAQKVITEALGVPNLWRNSKGIRACSDASISTGTHYNDITCFDTCNVSYYGSSTSGIEKNYIPIRIGHYPICPSCGKTHSLHNNIMCGSCQKEIANIVYCYCCDATLDYDCAIYDEDTGNYFCDSECAERYECYYCDNVDEWHSENVFWCDYCGEYFYDPNEERIVTEDGMTFINAETATLADYYYDEETETWEEL